MRYSFKSTREHNFYTIIKRRFYDLVWPIAAIAFIQYFFPKSNFAKDNWHLYSFLIIEGFNLFMILTSDSIKEIIIDTSKKRMEVFYFNIYQGNMEEKHPLSEIKVHIETKHTNEAAQIEFIIKKRTDIVLKKDNFSTYDLESLKELLHNITAAK